MGLNIRVDWENFLITVNHGKKTRANMIGSSRKKKNASGYLQVVHRVWILKLPGENQWTFCSYNICYYILSLTSIILAENFIQIQNGFEVVHEVSWFSPDARPEDINLQFFYLFVELSIICARNFRIVNSKLKIKSFRPSLIFSRIKIILHLNYVN